MFFIKRYNLIEVYMINIGVLTHSIADNYGANLQALSTGYYLRKNGFNPIFFKWDPYPSNNNSEQLKLHHTFLQRHGFELTSNCLSDEDFVEVLRKYDIKFIIVGSDCVFTHAHYTIPYRLSRKGIVKKQALPDWVFPNPFWLPFLERTPDVKAVIMSGSCGCSDLDKTSNEVSKKMSKCLDRFSYISVRDEYTRISLAHILGEDKSNLLPITPDPVFSFNQNVNDNTTKEQIMLKYNLPDKYIVTAYYKSGLPKTSWLQELKNEFNKLGYKIVNLTMPQGTDPYPYDININLPLDTMDWYNLIKYSNGYIGNNMHPIIVSIHNTVPFYSVNEHGKFYLRRLIQSVKHTKEYELLNRFNLLKYHTGINKIHSVSPLSIVHSVINFDVVSCKKCAKILHDEYKEMMKNILSMIE